MRRSVDPRSTSALASQLVQAGSTSDVLQVRASRGRVYRCCKAPFSALSASWDRGTSSDPRFGDLANVIEDDFAVLRSKYTAPRYPVVLAHGLLGFEELHVASSLFPGVQYWRGISDALRHAGVTVLTTTVPPSASIEERATALRDQISTKIGGHGSKPNSENTSSSPHANDTQYAPADGVNIIAHSMGGLDARYMISRLSSPVPIRSLTTIATPHRGSAVADYVLDRVVGPRHVRRVYSAMETLGLQTGAFSQLTRRYMNEDFNPNTPDVDGVRYFSYGAALKSPPRWWSMFRQPYFILDEAEGPNDGLVSVASSQWGGEDGYRGTLMDVSHLDLINWTNRLRWLIHEWTGNRRKFNAMAFYLGICDMLAEEGL